MVDVLSQYFHRSHILYLPTMRVGLIGVTFEFLDHERSIVTQTVPPLWQCTRFASARLIVVYWPPKQFLPQNLPIRRKAIILIICEDKIKFFFFGKLAWRKFSNTPYGKLAKTVLHKHPTPSIDITDNPIFGHSQFTLNPLSRQHAAPVPWWGMPFLV